VRFVAAATVAWGDVVSQVTLPAAFAHVYHDPAGASWISTTLATVGAIVNATESRFVGVVAFKVYAIALIVYPLIAPEPEPALLAGTVFVAVNAYAAEASTPATTSAARTLRRRLGRIRRIRIGSPLDWAGFESGAFKIREWIRPDSA